MIRFVLKRLTGCWLPFWVSVCGMKSCLLGCFLKCFRHPVEYQKLVSSYPQASFDLYISSSEQKCFAFGRFLLWLLLWLLSKWYLTKYLVFCSCFCSIFIFCCYNCARLTWECLYIHPFTGNKSDMSPERDPVKKLNKRPDLGSDCKSHIFFFRNCWFVYLYNFEELPSGSEFCCWNLEKFCL